MKLKLVLAAAVALAVLVGAGIIKLSPEGASAQFGGTTLASSVPVPVPSEGDLQFLREQVDAKDAGARKELTSYRGVCPPPAPDDTVQMLCSIKRAPIKLDLGNAQLACNKAVAAYNQAARTRVEAFPQERRILVDTRKPVTNPLTKQLLTCGDESRED